MKQNEHNIITNTTLSTEKHLRLITKSVFTLRETGDEASFAIAWQRKQTERSEKGQKRKETCLGLVKTTKKGKRKKKNQQSCSLLRMYELFLYLYRCSLFCRVDRTAHELP
jgi:hypothetical protein